MDRFKTLSIALSAGALAVSTPSMATTTTSFTGTGNASIVSGNGSFSDTAIPKGSFVDTITFTTAAGQSSVILGYFLLVKSGISALTASLNGVPVTFTLSTFGSGANVIKQQNGFASAATPATGINTLVISGVSAGAAASYSGTLFFSAAAVPEPATWLMMIGGIGLAGASLRRRHAPARKLATA